MELQLQGFIQTQQMEEEKPTSIMEIKLAVNSTSRNQQEEKPVNQGQEGKEKVNKEQENKNNDSDEKVRVKSKGRKIAIGLIISLSAVMFGYSIKEITSVPIDNLVQYYGITLDKFVAQSILIGILPLASVFGAIITKVLMKRFRRLSGIYVFTIVNCIAVGLINITNFGTLLAGRFLQGVCVGFYSAIAPIYLREIAPRELRKMLGLFFSLGKVLGVLIVIFVQLAITGAGAMDYGFRIILSLTALFSVLQAVLIFFFGSDTPTEMIEKGKHEKARQIIKNLYREQYVEEVMRQYTQQHQASTQNADETPEIKSDMIKNSKKKKRQKKTQIPQKNTEPKNKKNYMHQEENNNNKMEEESKNEAESSMWESQFYVRQSSMAPSVKDQSSQVGSKHSERPKLTFDQKRKKAYCLGVHLAIIRNFIGANAIITQGGIFIKHYNPGLGKYTSLIINMVQFISVVFGLVYVQTVMGKKPLFLLSIPLLSILNLALVVAMIYEQVLSILIILCIYMAVYGAGFISPIWAYPSEIIPASESLPSNILHWITVALCMLVPPLVSGIMPNNNPYPVFIFFGLYGFLGFAHVRWTLRESNGLTFKQIIQSFK